MTPEPLILAEPETPFWGFGEVFMMAAIFLIAVGLVGGAAVGILHDDARLGYWQVAAEFVAYLILFASLKLVFFWVGKPLFRSLGWVPQPFSAATLVTLGLALSVFSGFLLIVFRTPEIQTPFEKMLGDSAFSRIAMTVFGITLGPVIEELLFRGFIQPVVTSAIGVFPGILLTSLLFGGLHLSQNAGMWQSGAIITLAGFAFGTVRHISGSTRASALMHIGYNSLPFFLTLLNK
jgi:membrane protease YdiL (CAAX protease family)